MSKPQVTFSDPEDLQVTYLKDVAVGRDEEYAPVTVSTKHPAERLVDTTHVQVQFEFGDAGDYPVTERAQVRFTCHVPPDRRGWAKDLASLTQALVYSQPGTDAIAGSRLRGGRSNVITDPDTKNLMVWFLAEIPLNPALLVP